jgi:oligopeptide transport system substrate-binding protein
MSILTPILTRAALATALALGISSFAMAETVFHRGNGAEPETLDVHRSTGVPESWIQTDLFDGLVSYDAKGEPIPGAAESWTISDDGLTYTFKLRADGKWSDGTPVTADDFVFSWRRLVDPATASDYAYFLWPVLNAEEISKGEKPIEEMGVKAVDATTFEVTLRAPTPYFLASLVHHSTYAVSKANYEQFGEDFIKPGNLVSNGAYMLSEAVPQGYVKLVKNPYFHDAANVSIDTVMFYPTEDIDSELQRYLAGELDLTYEMPSQMIPTMRAEHPREMHISPYFGTYFYAYNLSHEPWKDSPELREALSLAVDRHIIIENITQGGQLPAYSFVPPDTLGYEQPEPEYADWSQDQRDERARELLDAAGYGPGGKPLSVQILYNTSENHKKIAIAIAAMWKQKLGIETTIQNEEWATFLESRDSKTFQDIARHGWIGDYNDANNFLELLRSDIGPNNTSAYANPEFDKLMIASTTEQDPAKRQGLMEVAEKIMLADFPIIPIYFYTSRHMLSEAVKGWQDNAQDQHPTRFLSIVR